MQHMFLTQHFGIERSRFIICSVDASSKKRKHFMEQAAKKLVASLINKNNLHGLL